MQETLDASSATNVKQMEQATREIFQTHSLAYRHNYKQSWQVLDVDMTGLPCGSKSVKADKGYFSKEGIRHGRQLALQSSLAINGLEDKDRFVAGVTYSADGSLYVVNTP